MAAGGDERSVRYEPEDRPPALVTAGVGLQAAMTIIAPVALTVVIVARIADQPDSYISWGVVAALLVSGIATILQAVRLGRIGSGHVLAMGTSGAFIAVCVAALDAGGPSLMASLVVVSSLFQFLLAARLSLLRRVFTPVVTGTVVMLIGVTVAPVLFDTMGDVPDGTARAAAPVAALATILTVAALVLRGSPSVRLWSPVAGIAVGCAAAAPFGIYDTNAVAAAPWVGFPVASWPGFDLTPDTNFWALLPAFAVVTIVGAVETMGDGIAIQQVSRRTPRATDFRVVQGALNADGVGNLLSGIAGTLPNTTYSSSLALAEVTGVAARRVGVVIGSVFIAVAFFPKISAVLIAIPGPVAAGYLVLIIGLLFVQGMRLVLRDGLTHRKAAVVGL
ncbi:MAG: xanthine/uracil/vitamin C permease, partial [Acidimicrobiia bacterium]|nr:xanthine/uracil/vitamin C permease [Acidimicrobiia bacterium]